MPFQITRRAFIAGLTAAFVPFPRIPSVFAAAASGPLPLQAYPFPLQQVRLLPGLFHDAADHNRRYVLTIEPDRLLHMSRITAGLPSSYWATSGGSVKLNGRMLEGLAGPSSYFRNQSNLERW